LTADLSGIAGLVAHRCCHPDVSSHDAAPSVRTKGMNCDGSAQALDHEPLHAMLPTARTGRSERWRNRRIGHLTHGWI